MELETCYETRIFGSDEPRSGSGDEVLNIFFQFPHSVVQSYFM